MKHYLATIINFLILFLSSYFYCYSCNKMQDEINNNKKLLPIDNISSEGISNNNDDNNNDTGITTRDSSSMSVFGEINK